MPCLFAGTWTGLQQRGEKTRPILNHGSHFKSELCNLCVCKCGSGHVSSHTDSFCNSLHNKCNIHRHAELPVTAQQPLTLIPISDAPEWAPLLPWTVWDTFCPGEKQWCWMTYQSPSYSPSTPTPSTESLLFSGIDNLLYQGFHLLLIPSFPSYQVSPNGLFLPKEPDPHRFISKIQSLPESAPIGTQPNTLCQKRIHKATKVNINTSLREEHSNK